MKRVFGFLFLILVLAGVVFFFGWVQIRIPADSYGVIFSRTSGWESSVIEPGTFVWRWQRLIPTNMKLYVYDPGVHTTDVTLDGDLPSGAGIEALLAGSISFEYHVRLSVTTRIAPQSLPELTRDEGLLPDSLTDYYKSVDTRISRAATDAVLGLVASRPESLATAAAASSVVEEVSSALERSLPQLSIIAVTAERIDVPDVGLYLEAKRLATSVLEARAEAMRQAASRLANVQAQTDQNLALLERYGEILDKYPVLLDYFKAGQEIGGDPLNLEAIIPNTGR